MRRKIELYIGECRADLDDQALVLYNYAFTDLQAPTAVKNSYSKQVTLPGTPGNAAIFGHPSRPDRRTSGDEAVTGPAFNPGRKTPFTIYDELGEVLESGYVRLDAVVRKGAVVTGYKVSLFGGLGAFFYSLSYREDGEKMTLADLHYLPGTDKETELDFTINADAVAAAWARVYNSPTALAQLWDVINFAPAYNGAPDGDFSADKGIINAANAGLDDHVLADGEYYDARGGLTIVNLPKPVDEGAAKDIRSYLQRPVLSWRAFLRAISQAAENGGYEVDYSGIPGNYYKSIYKTLPMLTTLGSGRKITGEAELTNAGGTYTTGAVIGEVGISGTIPQGMKTSALIKFYPWMHVDTSNGAALGNEWSSMSGTKGANLVAYFFQAVAYNGLAVLGASPVKVISTRTNWDWKSITEQFGVGIEVPSAGFERAENNPPDIVGAGVVSSDNPLALRVNTSFPPTRYVIYVHTLQLQTEYDNHVDPSGGETFIEQNCREIAVSILHPVNSAMNFETATDYYVALDLSTSGSVVTYESPDGIRSGARITKAQLLQSAHTPAEYLISWAKSFGLVFLCDTKEKRVTIVTRNDFFDTGQAVIDLSSRVDRSQDITIKPLNQRSKWYEFKGEVAAGAFAEEYKALYGVDFGTQRVNTGYDFDAAAVNLADGIVFRQAATKLAHGRYWEIILVDGYFRPSPFLDTGVTYTLWEEDTGEAKTFPVPGIPTAATMQMYNIDHDYYDIDGSVLRLDLADKDGKPVDGTDILVSCSSGSVYARFKISDDTADMFSLNDGKPCWNLTSGGLIGIRIPTFAQFVPGAGADEYNITRALNYGRPREVDIPGCSFGVNASLYARFWRAFLADQLDVDTKVMTCRVRFDGIRIGPELLRRFYFYEGALWVLNKITNYSLTTWDPVECELVQVQDRDNYTDGQITD